MLPMAVVAHPIALLHLEQLRLRQHARVRRQRAPEPLGHHGGLGAGAQLQPSQVHLVERVAAEELRKRLVAGEQRAVAEESDAHRIQAHDRGALLAHLQLAADQQLAAARLRDPVGQQRAGLLQRGQQRGQPRAAAAAAARPPGTRA
jgi:hypothetical protein